MHRTEGDFSAVERLEVALCRVHRGDELTPIAAKATRNPDQPGAFMIYLVTSDAYALRERREVRRWYADNGIAATEVVEPIIVDPEQATITVVKTVPVEGQEDQDFPELRTDDDLNVVTVQETVALRVPPPSWMLQPTS
jgi:hypothetical protein